MPTVRYGLNTQSTIKNISFDFMPFNLRRCCNVPGTFFPMLEPISFFYENDQFYHRENCRKQRDQEL